MQIYLVRHGQASAGTDNYDRLSTLGIKQSKLLGEFWYENAFEIDYAFSGSLERQQHTARYALDTLPSSPDVKTIEALNEYDHVMVDDLFGGDIGASDELNLSFDQYLSIMNRWRNASTEILEKPPGAMAFDTFSNQGWVAIQSAALEINKTHGASPTCVFFTSGGVIATILQKLLNLEFKATMDMIWQTQNTSITQLKFEFAKGEISDACLVNYNTVPHLHLHHDKTLITQI